MGSPFTTHHPSGLPTSFKGSNTRSDRKSVSFGSNNSSYDNGISNYQIVSIVPLEQHLDTSLVETKITT